MNASSMADIAFLLLIFFIITSNVINDKAVMLKLPIIQAPQEVKSLEENVCTIVMNNENELLVRGEKKEMNEVTDFVKKFILNNGRDPKMSRSSKDAVVVFKPSRGGKNGSYIKLINQVQLAYFDIWAVNANVTTETLMSWDVEEQESLSKALDKLREVVPYNFVVAETEK